MGCQLCSKNSEIKLENIPIYENKFSTQRNLNYLFLQQTTINKVLKLNEQNTTADSKISSLQIISPSNIIKNENINYLEYMRESMFNEINLIRLNPQLIEKRIEKYFPFITTLPKESFIQVDINNKIKLNKGNYAFESCKLVL